MRSRAALLTFLIVAASTSATLSQVPTADATAAALLAKHRAYVGWQLGDGTFMSMRIKGHATDEKGKRVETFTMTSAGVVYHNTTTIVDQANATIHTGYTGKLFWRADVNGFPTPVYGDYAKYLASLTVLRQEGTSELPATSKGDKTVDGKSLSVVRVTLANGDPIDCYVDPQTGAYVQAIIDPDGSYETTIHIRSYADVLPGKKMISSYRLDDDKTLVSYDTFEPNVPIADTDLHPPQATASWTFELQDPVPITMTHDRMLVDATVNGVKGRFILDTGADAIILDNRFADRAKAVELKATADFDTLYGSVPTRVMRADTVSIGGATLHTPIVYSQDFHKSAMGTYRGLDFNELDGLIGYDLFAATIVKLDVYGAKISVLDPSTDLSAQSGLQLIVDLSEGTPIIPMTLNKSIPVNAMLDTGNPGVVFMSWDLAKKHHLMEYSEGCSSLESLAIGPITYSEQEACAAALGSNEMLIGFDFLKRFDFVFDYPHGRIFLTPNKN
ncbi:MAG TPA: pepsin/retropepsin-like aspartic protease family protein [Candidatus Cybelea sp.]|jgi:predicted aspartyl protease|nr:pepsin/retropepsin-like aspartic protease family protein [Candidatus Cybelea sp.]